MKKKRFSVEQITAVLQQAEGGVPVGDVCRQVGISEQTYYRWKRVYGGMPPSEARELKQLRDENAKLKRLVGHGPERSDHRVEQPELRPGHDDARPAHHAVRVEVRVLITWPRRTRGRQASRPRAPRAGRPHVAPFARQRVRRRTKTHRPSRTSRAWPVVGSTVAGARASALRYLGGMRKAPGIPVSSVASFDPCFAASSRRWASVVRDAEEHHSGN